MTINRRHLMTLAAAVAMASAAPLALATPLPLTREEKIKKCLSMCGELYERSEKLGGRNGHLIIFHHNIAHCRYNGVAPADHMEYAALRHEYHKFIYDNFDFTPLPDGGYARVETADFVREYNYTKTLPSYEDIEKVKDISLVDMFVTFAGYHRAPVDIYTRSETYEKLLGNIIWLHNHRMSEYITEYAIDTRGIILSYANRDIIIPEKAFPSRLDYSRQA